MDNEEERRTLDPLLFVFIVFFTVQRENKEVPLFNNNRIVPCSSHIFRIYNFFFILLFLKFDLYYTLLTRFISWLKG